MPLVIKILQDDGTGSEQRGFQTIGDLLGRIQQANEGRQMRGEPLLQSNPVFLGLPLFRFQGQLQGKEVCGYACYRLDTAGYVALDTIMDGQNPALWMEYQQLPSDRRLQLAADLSELFAVFDREFGYVQADVNGQNIWVNLVTARLTGIDYDGGGIVSNSGTPPSTFGKMGDWLAPEILEALKGGAGSPIPVNYQTDGWAVGIGISYLLLQAHPFMFLERLNRDAIAGYLAANQWPSIDRNDPNYNQDNEALYDGPVQRAFVRTLQEGALDPARRLSASRWHRALMGQGALPIIHLFEADPPVSTGTSVVLRWWVEDADEVEVTPLLGMVPGMQSRLVFPTTDIRYCLRATGLFGTATAECSVQVLPSNVAPTPVGGPVHHPVPAHRKLHGLAFQLGKLFARGHRKLLAGGLRRKSSRSCPDHTLLRGAIPQLTLPAFPWRTLYRRLDAILISLR